MLKTRDPGSLDETFFLRENAEAETWADRVAYDRYYRLAAGSPLTIADNLVLWTLTGRSQDGYVVRRRNREGLSRLTGYSAKTVGRALGKLEELGFILGFTASSRGLNPPDAKRLAMFWGLSPSVRDTAGEAIASHILRVKGSPRLDPPGPDDRRRAIETAVAGYELNQATCDILNELDDRNFTSDEIRYVMDAHRLLGHREAAKLFDQASRQHRRLHRPLADDCFALFRYKVEKHTGKHSK